MNKPGKIAKSAENANLPRIPIKNVEGHTAQLVSLWDDLCYSESGPWIQIMEDDIATSLAAMRRYDILIGILGKFAFSTDVSRFFMVFPRFAPPCPPGN